MSDTANKKLWVIGISGTNGAGKDTISQLIAEHHNYLFITVSDLLRAEVKRRGLPSGRESTRLVSTEWRRELGLSVLVDKAIADFEVVRDQYSGVVIASLRNPGEADKIHALGGTVVWIDADPKIRYDRIQLNAASRNRAGDDDKTFEQFLAEEEAEMHTTGDAATLDMAAVKAKSDVFIDNSHDTFEQLKAHVDEQLGL